MAVRSACRTHDLLAMPSPRRTCVAIALACATTIGGLGCSVGDDQSHPPHKRVNERRQTRAAAARTLVRYCRTHPQPAGRPREEAREAVDRLIGSTRGYAASSYERQVRLHDLLVAVATFLEREHCLPDQVARVDRAIRLLPLPQPPAPVEPEEPPDDEPPYP